GGREWGWGGGGEGEWTWGGGGGVRVAPLAYASTVPLTVMLALAPAPARPMLMDRAVAMVLTLANECVRLCPPPEPAEVRSSAVPLVASRSVFASLIAVSLTLMT